MSRILTVFALLCAGLSILTKVQTTPLFSREYSISGAALRVFSPAKTVADCFKFRSKVGLDVAIEALKECRQQKKASIDELAAAAKVCRVANVMRPYLESL
jgi:hypothetical protein